MNELAKQSLLVMGWAVVGSQIVTHAVVSSLVPEYLSTALLVSPIVSSIVAAPLTYAFFRQNVKLAEANGKLEAANRILGYETAIAKREAKLDPMTSVLNRTHFVREIEINRATNEPPGFFLMLDADNFKNINDTFGHVVGDAVLLKITQVISMTLRDNDIVGRLGGEEFGIYLRNVTRDQARDIAERIRARVANTPIDVGNGKTHQVTVSIGAAFAQESHDLTELMQMADRNLYEAKDKGRNTVVFNDRKLSDSDYRVAV